MGKLLSGLWECLVKAIGGTVGSIGDAIDKNVTNKEEKMKLKNEIAAKMAQFELDAQSMILDDRKSAREMQMTALSQSDTFSKRYIYFLASGVLLAAIGSGAVLMFVDIPLENKRLVEMFFDIFLFAGAITVINFFFGSSTGSTNKQKVIDNIAVNGK